MNAPDLIILGPQGSGKTTQAELLAKTFGFALLGAGDLLREIAQEDTELGRKVRQTINVEGRLVQPELISEVIKAKVATGAEKSGIDSRRLRDTLPVTIRPRLLLPREPITIKSAPISSAQLKISFAGVPSAVS